MTPPPDRGRPTPARTRRSRPSAAGHEDRRRTFPAVPPRTGEETAASWWGAAWVRALEESALDPARLARGRAYARRGLVDAITVTPGLITAYVHGSRPRPYRTRIRLRVLGDGEWDDLLTAAAGPEHIAALLDKDIPRALAATADLLPGSGDLVPDCSCPDDGFPCKHAAALCYQAARLLDEDPFALFLLRGRGEREILDALTRRDPGMPALPGAPAAGETAGSLRLPTVPADTALAAARGTGVLPPPFPVPARPGRPPAGIEEPGAPDPLAIDLLATEAAQRAHALLTTGVDPVAGLTVWEDTVRLAAAHPGAGLTASTRALYRDLAGAVGRTAVDLARAVAAWHQGGRAALAVLEEPWDPPAGPFDRAGPALTAAGLPGFRPLRNRLSTPAVQLRLGRDGRWYGYESDPGRDEWWPRGTPDTDPVGAATALLGP
ncbi:SWIM zinc finger family protein [Streptomyces sp. NPDC058953]|uniref:SWIM zinc finger family protein n=1 Tax=unclassified Streptomyces TaxID=2593676 RepID=UPI0036C6E531